MTPIVNDNKNYGDQKAIDDLKRQASGIKQGMGDDVPTIRRPRGRPSGGGAAVAPAAATVQTGEIPEEHRAMMEDFARTARAAKIFQQIAEDPTSGSWARIYADVTKRRMTEKAERLREVFPDFDLGV